MPGAVPPNCTLAFDDDFLECFCVLVAYVTGSLADRIGFTRAMSDDPIPVDHLFCALFAVLLGLSQGCGETADVDGRARRGDRREKLTRAGHPIHYPYRASRRAMHVELIALTQYLRGQGTPEELLEHAGRICYRSESRGRPAAFLRARIREGHESLIEHASATFEISGISRACSHQLVRHRLASYSQESQRYVDMSDPALVIPDAIAADPRAQVVWDGFVEQVKSAYQELRELGVLKEDARFVLPNAAATRIIVTMNFRELLHFFRLRIAPEAQWEIRRLAVSMLELLTPRAPAVFNDLRDDLRRAHPEFFEASGESRVAEGA